MRQPQRQSAPMTRGAGDWNFLTIAAVALVATACCIVPATWVQIHLALRFPAVFIGAAVGAPVLVGAVMTPGRGRWVAVVGAAFAAWCTVSAVASNRVLLALLGNFDKANGAVLAMAIAGGWALGQRSGGVVTVLTRVIVGAVALNAAVALLQGSVDLSGLDMGLLAGRTPGLWGNPVHLGAFLLGGLWVTHRAGLEPRLEAAVTALAAMGIVLAGSRFSLAGVGVVVVAAALADRKRARFLVVPTVVGLAAGFAVATVGIVGTENGAHRLAQASQSGSITTRLEWWAEAGHAVEHHPVFGVGPGRFLDATGPYTTLRATSENPPDDAHNLIVEYTTTTGIVGGLLFTIFIAGAVWRAGWRHPLAGFGLAILATGMLEPQQSSLTPLAFLALGAAAAGAGPALGSGWRRLATGLVALGAFAGAAVVWGNVVANRNRPVPAGYADARTARTLLRPWAIGYTKVADLDTAVAVRTSDIGLALRAASWRRAAAEKEPGIAALWIDLGVVERLAGDGRRTRQAFARAVADDPWSISALEGLAEADRQAGDRAAAHDAYLRVLRESPSDSVARQGAQVTS